MEGATTVAYADFEKIEVRVGRIVAVEDFPEAHKPAYKLIIDLGQEIGTKRSSAQLAANYTKEALQNNLVLCVVNFAPRQIGPFISEVLTLGVPDMQGNCILITPDSDVPLGGKLY